MENFKECTFLQLYCQKLAHIGTGINNVMHFFRETNCSQGKKSCLAEEVLRST